MKDSEKYLSFKAPLMGKHGSVWGSHIFVPPAIVQHFADQDVTRFLCTLNDSITLNSALMPNGNGSYFITINKDTVNKLRLEIGKDVSIRLEADKSKYGMPMPEEFQEMMYQDPEVDQIFHALTPGKQRSLLYMIAKPKGVETRIKKAIVISEYLKDCKGKLDYKELNQAFKNYTAR